MGISQRIQRAALVLAAPLLAMVVAAALISVILLIAGDAPDKTFRTLGEAATRPRLQVLAINNAITYFLVAIAVAIGFRMNLFNIGVEGQLRLGALLAAAAGGALRIPAVLDVALIIVVAAAVGSVWASIAALLKAYRGVSEVISTIMLNFIAYGIIGWLLNTDRLAVPVAGSNNIGTRPIPSNGQVPGLSLISDTPNKVYGLLFLAIAVGIAYHVVLGRTRFGFDLRATGLSEYAAVSSGVSVRKMVISTMLISGALAGIAGMPILLGDVHSYSLSFPGGLGFTGIAIALLGRNQAVGIALASLLWGFLDSTADQVGLIGVPKEIVAIMQGFIVLSVVIAYELVRRLRLAQEQRRVGRELAATPIAEGASV